MAGGGGSIRSNNVFAALDSLKKKKKSKASAGQSRAEPEPAEVFWAPTPIKSISWADVDDEDDYFATAEPLEKLPATKEEVVPAHLLEEESESGDDDIEDSDDHEPKLPVPAEPVLEKPPPAPVAPKDTDRQLSKKELKKKELAELEAVLAELGLSGKDNTNGIDGQEETYDASREKKLEEHIVDGERKDNAAGPTESKASKKKKAKKERASKEVKDSQVQLNVDGPDEKTDNSEPAEEDQSALDVKELLKKVASKKKKSSKEMDTAAKAVQVEAAARRAKFAAAKKKEKNNSNQQPVR